jgi:hypothetical protein
VYRTRLNNLATLRQKNYLKDLFATRMNQRDARGNLTQVALAARELRSIALRQYRDGVFTIARASALITRLERMNPSLFIRQPF